MNRKGIIAVGPALVFVNLAVLILASIKIIFAMGLVSGVVFNKRIKELGWRSIVPKITVFVLLTLAIIVAVNITFGPAYNHHAAMLYGSAFFLVIAGVLSINSIRADPKDSIITILLLTLLFTFISQLSVYVVIR